MKTIEKIKTFITNNKLSLYRYDLFALNLKKKKNFSIENSILLTL